MVRDATTGKYRRVRLFVLTLGCSRKCVRLLTWRSSAQIWAELHERAFRRLGGTVKVIVLDNLGEGVLTPDIYDPGLNPLYRDVLAHYGVVALPCRVGDPDRKGKVEAGVSHAQKTPLKGLRFETIEAAQAYLDRWEARWAETRIHGTTKRQVAVMFAEERPSGRSLEPFRYYRFGIAPSILPVRSRRRVLRRAAGGSAARAQWNDLYVTCWPPTGQLLRSICARGGGHRIQTRTDPRARRRRPGPWRGQSQARTSHGVHAHPAARRRAGHPSILGVSRSLETRAGGRRGRRPGGEIGVRPIAFCGSMSTVAHPCP
jgi:hypothetical protein